MIPNRKTYQRRERDKADIEPTFTHTVAMRMMALSISAEVLELETHCVQAALKLLHESSLNIFFTFNIEAIKLK